MNALMWALLFTLEIPKEYLVKIEPFDIQDEQDPRTFLVGINQLEVDNDILYIRANNEASILRFHQEGQLLDTIGHKGRGPGVLEYDAIAMAVDGPALWLLTSDWNKAYYFENGTFLLDFSLADHNISLASQTSNDFAFDNRRLLAAAFPGSKHLANVYDYGGELIRRVGDILPVDRDLLRKNPALNDTLWNRDGRFWYCLFKYYPLLLKFDENFEEVARFELTGPEIDERNDALADHKPKHRYHYPAAHFNDFKIFRRQGFFLCGGALYQMDLDRGVILSRTRFYGTGAHFSNISYPGAIMLYFFSFFSDGTLVLAHPGMMWEHDLWKTRLPYLKDTSDPRLASSAIREN